MFYSLQEVMDKLGKTEAEIKTLVREGKLREFRDGAKQLYKVEDVDAIVTTPAQGDAAVLDDSLQVSLDETGEVSLAPEELDVLMSKDEGKNESEFKLDETGELVADEALDKPGKSGIEISKGDTAKSQTGGAPAGGTGTDVFAKMPEEKKDDTKISLSSDSINILGESDTEYKISEDTSGETKLVEKGPKSLDEKGKGDVGRLDEDVNLEGVGGSGSGLLDLSLQADDTSLGAVLDDIYPESPAAAAPIEQAPAAPGDAMEQEAEKMLEQADAMPAEQAAMADAIPAGAVFITEVPPDAASNTIGITLFAPLVVLIYTAIVVASGYKPISELKMLSSIEPIIWYVAGGVAGFVIVIALIGSFIGQGGPKQPKPPKPPKVKKEKKAKKEKEPPAKEK